MVVGAGGGGGGRQRQMEWKKEKVAPQLTQKKKDPPLT
jgi:hypothetical protein